MGPKRIEAISRWDRSADGDPSRAETTDEVLERRDHAAATRIGYSRRAGCHARSR